MNGHSGRWSTAQVARLSKATSRTLRHYDHIGLLRPAAVAGSGLRYYEREQLLRLQQILLLRDLGLSLDAISSIVNEGGDRVEQLHHHHQWLLRERDRIERLAQTVAATIEELEGGEKVKVEELFENFGTEKQARYEAELVDRYGDQITPHIAESKRRMASWTKADATHVQQQWHSLLARLVELIEAGAEVGDGRVQAIIAEHYRWVGNFWTPNRESYPGLAHNYADAADFRTQFDAQHPRLAEFLRDAMLYYARTRL